MGNPMTSPVAGEAWTSFGELARPLTGLGPSRGAAPEGQPTPVASRGTARVELDDRDRFTTPSG